MAGQGCGAPLVARLADLDRSKEAIAKGWLLEMLSDSSLPEIESMAVTWAARELPNLITDILRDVDEAGAEVDGARRRRAGELGAFRGPHASAPRLAKDLAALHTGLAGALRGGAAGEEARALAEIAERLTTAFGSVGAAAFESMPSGAEAADRDPATDLPGHRRLLRRVRDVIGVQRTYGHPFALVLLDVEGTERLRPADRSGLEGAMLSYLTAAVREETGELEELYRIENGDICVLAPDRTAAEAKLLATRLTSLVAIGELGGGGGGVSAGVASCPQHGTEPEALLARADTAMWRARASGETVGVAETELQDR